MFIFEFKISKRCYFIPRKMSVITLIIVLKQMSSEINNVLVRTNQSIKELLENETEKKKKKGRVCRRGWDSRGQFINQIEIRSCDLLVNNVANSYDD